MPDWTIKSIEVSGGFLAGLSLELPRGLTCIIGPRGSGKSTLAEAVRYALLGAAGAPKTRLELLQANLRGSVTTLRTFPDSNGDAFIVRRTFQQPPTITSLDGRPLADVDLDRGTFLPLDAYGSAEIELIADESLGEKRRMLLDELKSKELRDIQLASNERRRQLEANADAIRSAERSIADVTEQIEEIGDARARLAAFPPPPPGAESGSLIRATQQQQFNEREGHSLRRRLDMLEDWRAELDELHTRYKRELGTPTVVEDSANSALMSQADKQMENALAKCASYFTAIDQALVKAQEEINALLPELSRAHADQKLEFDKLNTENLAAGQAVRERAQREQEVAKLEDCEKRRTEAIEQLQALRTQRESLRAAYLLEREKLSRVRSTVATQLQRHAGAKVRIRVLENADLLGYKQVLTEGLRGAGVRNHEDILAQLLCLRPEHLAQLIADNDVIEFDEHTGLGKERSAKILDAYRRNIDVFELEVVAIDDQVKIELNVSSNGDPHFKDASELSRGQKCTALLPLLLARRTTPLLIDQPEDNLDNHFIYETVVDSIRRLKQQRQMLFITHNANIPVLGDADLVVVMNSDGKRGYVEKTGSLDDCRPEIIDLLEGGEEAFDLRRQRYGR